LQVGDLPEEFTETWQIVRLAAWLSRQTDRLLAAEWVALNRIELRQLELPRSVE
jgi:hypothetical protein